jgi:glycosyltransferase involved in cell wall biosynthesis
MKPKVGIIGSRGYPSFYGGFETAVRELAPYLADNGWQVVVYGRSRAVDANAPGDPRVISVITRGIETRSLSTLTFGLTAVLHALRHKPDVALVLNVANGFWIPLLRLRGIPVVTNVDGIEWERAKWGTVAKAVFKAGARMTAIFSSRLVADAEEIGRRWQRDFNKASIFIPYGGRTPASLPVPQGLRHRGYVLFVARFVPENTVGEFFEAAEIVAREYPVIIVGSSGYGGPLEEQAALLCETNNNITWLGHISNDAELLSLWQHAGAYFHGHSVGGTNPALVQAMACGCPIVARDTTYNREVLGTVGTYVSPDSIEISRAIVELMRSDGSERSKALQNRAAERYSWPAVCASYEETLRLAMQQRRGLGQRA